MWKKNGMGGVWAAVVMALGGGCAGAPVKGEAPSPAVAADVRVVLAEAVEWEMLNPARGEASPKAATLWGDRKADVPTGFLVRFVDGFSSPPHIHNVSYRGVVLSGEVHNDDPAAAAMWMPPGSYWTQPKGEVHITSAKGAETTAYIEIDAGPYLVRPVERAFESGERPVNVHASNLVWVDAWRLGWGARPAAAEGARVAFLWGDPNGKGPAGVFLAIPAGGAATVRSAAMLRGVVVAGRVEHRVTGGDGAAMLTPSSHFSAQGAAVELGCAGRSACTVYLHTRGDLDID